MTTTGARLTYQEYLDSAETMLRYEIVDGELIMSAAPNIDHQRTSRRILIPLERFVTDHGIGKYFTRPWMSSFSRTHRKSANLTCCSLATIGLTSSTTIEFIGSLIWWWRFFRRETPVQISEASWPIMRVSECENAG